MDYHEILTHLTTVDKTDSEMKDFNARLQQILEKVLPMLMKTDEQFVINDSEDGDLPLDTRYRYIRTVVRVLQTLEMPDSSGEESLISVKEFHSLKVCIELITAMGVLPNLLHGVGIDIAKLCPKAILIQEEKLTDLQKYRRLRFTVDSLMELYTHFTLRPAILAQLGSLFAALLQLCHAPLMKPSAKSASAGQTDISKDGTFTMTTELYEKLKRDQEHFKRLLRELLDNCPTSTSMKELMVILGVKEAPKWLQRETRKYLVEQIIQPNGIVSIVTAVCDDFLDLGEHWNKLDTVCRLIVTSHGNNSEDYYKSICPQLLNLLESTRIKHSTTIANCCVTSLYEHNPEVFQKHVLQVICHPLLATSTGTEDEVERCIENLTKCFVTVEAKFKQLPCKLLLSVSLPLFSLWNGVRTSVCVLKHKIKQLLLRLLHEESFRNDLYAAYLGHNSFDSFGNRLETRLGPTGRIELVGTDTNLKRDEFADSLFELTSTSDTLSNGLFFYLLTFLSLAITTNGRNESRTLLETPEDQIGKIEERLTAVKLLSSLANVSSVQEAQIKNPQPICSFIRTLFTQYIETRKGQNSSDDDSELLYVSLMLVKMIISERKEPLEWAAFTDFVKFLKECCTLTDIPSHLSSLTRECIELIESHGKSEQRNYQDLSVSRKRESDKFEEALRDLADPLLPVRAHGLITLTKLIETMDPCIVARKAVVLQLFQSNLKHEDSFIYLAAINGLCALASSYPQMIIELLVHEYIDISERVSAGEIATETRIKLGEILVKVTRSLGEMASAYKNILINGFLCAARDPDPLVRASSLSCLGELCKVLGFRLGDAIIEVIYCIGCIVKTDKAPECRRAAVMVSTLLLRGLGKDTLTSLGKDLVDLYRGLKHLRDNDEDPVLRLHAQLALEELDYVMRDFLFSPPKLEKKIFLLK
ncbi:transport and Golgi organization protein 6 homolog [Ceratina calcarata]|uniref:Transport and Golgi organization protein 6 homolog n=1 Tax=Ceratina calcarata TaxID=156304 RepID=A0AAJ7J4V3_9HYME|nr:transport and Golgi organization protein 6 homolog [Ceratina calcarata]XP_017884517.1 transport and Golgi organization protein 6 homolog [Ceratina calcarata]XP_017884518.1 transport and Golgi organization protein 6 homolog [Ceratina calcarata]